MWCLLVVKKTKEKMPLGQQCFYPDDKPTSFNNPYSKFAINLISVLLLGKGFSSINNGYFISVLVAVVPLLGDAFACRPSDFKRRIIQRIEIAGLFVPLAIGVLGVLNILGVESINNVPRIIVVDFAFWQGRGFPALLFYLSILLSFLLSVVQVFLMRTPADAILNGITQTANGG